MKIDRRRLRQVVALARKRSRGIALVGPRQVSKTTLARSRVPADSPNYFDLEYPRVDAQIAAPLTTLENRRGLVVIDEVQRAPELFKTLRVLPDRERSRAKDDAAPVLPPQVLAPGRKSSSGTPKLFSAQPSRVYWPMVNTMSIICSVEYFADSVAQV